MVREKRHMPLLALVLATAALGAEPPLNTPPPGFIALFNGKDLTNWKDEGKAKGHWTIRDGALYYDGKGDSLVTSKEYGDFELFVDWKILPKGDSGIYLRGMPQVQIWDTTKEGGYWKLGADKGSGGLWNNSPGAPGKDPLALADRPFGQWNHLRIIQVGARTTVDLNDALVVNHAPMENYWDRSQPLFARGPIQLQTHGGEIRWRDA